MIEPLLIQVNKRRQKIEEVLTPKTPDDFCTINWSNTTSAFDTDREASPVNELTFARVLLDDIRSIAKLNSGWRNAIWMEKYLALLEYGKEHGHCNVPCFYEYILSNGKLIWLGEWLSRQRRCIRQGCLSSERLNLLQLLIRHKLLSPDNLQSEHIHTAWHSTYLCLEEFIDQHNHGDVPWNYVYHTKEHVAVHLGVWVSRQRRNKKLNRLEKPQEEHLQALVDRGLFSWTAPHADADVMWEQKYEALLRYGDLNGHCNVKYSEMVIMEDGSMVHLGSWLKTQKSLWKKNKLKSAKHAKMQQLVDRGMLRWARE